MIASIPMHLRRRLNARRFGVPFARRASFVVPKRIRLGAQFVPLALPPEHGAQSDFVTCFINDDYGLSKTKGPVKTIADIGANIGFFSMAARSYFPNATIHAYEPNPRILQYSTTNAACAEFTLFSEAVGRTTGLVSIVDCGDSNQARTSSAENRVASVPQVVFSTVVRRLGGQIDLVKIDCEGAEWELFADEIPWLAVKRLRMEYHLSEDRTYTDLECSLSRLGFQIHHHQPSGLFGTVWARNIKVIA